MNYFPDKERMQSLSQKIRPSFLIFFIAFLPRILHLIFSKAILPYEFRLNDGLYFDILATSLIQGVHTSTQVLTALSPVYNGFLYFIYKIMGHDLLWPRLIQMVMGSLACVGLHQIARNLFGIRAGWIAGLLAAFCGVFIYFDMLLIKTSLINSLIVFVLWALQRGGADGKSKWVAWIGGGIAMMMVCMLRMQFLLTLPWIAWIGMRQAWIEKKKVFWLGGFLLVLAMAGTQSICMTWFESTLFQTKGAPAAEEIAAPQGGIHFFIGNHRGANGTYKKVEGIRPSPVGHAFDAKSAAEKKAGRALSMKEVDSFWLGEGVKEIFSDLPRWGFLELKKFFLVLNEYEIPNSHNYDYWRPFSRVLSLPLVSCGWLAPLAILGWIRLRKDHRPMVQLLKGMAATYILALLLTFVTSDYRLPLYPIWIIFSAFALDQVWANLMEKNLIQFGRAAILFTFLFVFCNYETYLDKHAYSLNIHSRAGIVLNSKQQPQPQTQQSQPQSRSRPQNSKCGSSLPTGNVVNWKPLPP